MVQSRAVAQPPAVDIHAHFFPESFLRVIEERGEPFGARVDRASPKGPAIVAGGMTGPPLDATYWDLDRRVRAMDRAGVQVHALSLTTPMVHWARGDVARRAAEAVNDAMAEAHLAYPDRFIGCATLPMHEPPLAQGELERVATLKGIRAVYLGTNVNGRELSAPEFAPVFARLEALGLPVLLHPISVVGAERLRPFYLHNLLGNPFDTAIAAAHLVFGGVLDRHPKLQVCLPHAGGALPYLVGRLGHGQRVRPEARERARRPFERYLRRFTYDTISHSGDALRYLIATVGADRVMLGSDFCFDMGYERPRDIITKHARLGKTDQARVLGGNALRLLRLS
ncbi:MAG: aminocarboxymuconate-semialdehyde decarboxylase [Candidatus Rokuibacteriota bacterium]|nr:MAG: aminocarboxymuconate-semialdehyde decarboxylase [Candidatus Rokubacteria bacterium]PYN70394.1 MAG: aminocarboxymuconate-semialdehyde decarboxylase [Candidatus Rokubacteria bacterium]